MRSAVVGLEVYPIIVTIRDNCQAVSLQFLFSATVKNVCINPIAFCGGVSYRCSWSVSILSASRLLSLLATRGFRDHAHVAPYFSHIVLLLGGVSAFLDAAAPRVAEVGGARPPRPGS